MRKCLFILGAAVVLMLVMASTALADTPPPWTGTAIATGTTISHGMGPTFGETWPVPCPSTETYINSHQGSTGGLALIPVEDLKPELDAWTAEAASMGIPVRMHYSVIGKSGSGVDQYAVVINDLETPAQQTGYANWQTIRAEELTNPAQALTDLASFGDNVKMSAVQCHIHGNEYEAVDANMQEIRDLMETPMGVNPTIDNILNNEVLVFIIDENPDGRLLSQRASVTGIDPNRDYFQQSLPEQQNDVAVQVQYLGTVALEGHGYENPTLVDGDTIPHNPGIDEDIFEHWNMLRVEQVRADFANSGLGAPLTTIQSPIRDWNETGGTSTHNYTIAAVGVPGLHDAADGTVTVNFTGTATSIIGKGDEVIISGNADGYNGTYTVTSPNSLTAVNTFQCQITAGPVTGLPDSGGGTAALPPQPNLAQSWDDWGPFYQQSYAALLGGPDSTTLEMTSTSTGHGANWNSKMAQYIAFYGAHAYWDANKTSLMHDQIEIYLRGVTGAVPNPNAFANDPVLSSRYFADAWQNYMETYPTAYIIPWGVNQRSNLEANKLVKWLFDNGVQVSKATSDFSWNSTTYSAGSYVVWMNQALRGMAWNALAAGSDISGTKITTLYATPAVWSHGAMWGADVVEIPHGDGSFAPTTSLVSSPNTLTGGIVGGVNAAADWYSVDLTGVHEYPALRALLNGGVKGLMAEASFTSTTGGAMPAGTLIFGNTGSAARTAIDAFGAAAGVMVQRNVGVTMPATSTLAKAPRIAYLVSTLPNATWIAPGQSQTTAWLDSIWGFDAAGNQNDIYRLVANRDWGFVDTQGSTGTALQDLNNASNPDPLLNYDVIYTTLTSWPSSTYATARARLAAFFARGGGLICQNISSAGFLTGATPSPLLTGTLTQSSTSAYGSIIQVNNVGTGTSPITGPIPSVDNIETPSSTTYYSATPTGAVVDEQYSSNVATISADGPLPAGNGYLAGLWGTVATPRSTSVNGKPVLIHGLTTAGSRYVFLATDSTNKLEEPREWLDMLQGALWTNKTDEDTTAPVTTAAADPSGWTSGNVTVTLSATDAGVGVANTYYQINGGAQQTYDPAAKIVLSGVGEPVVTYWSVDFAGNTETASTIQAHIENPAILITSANSGSFTQDDASSVAWSINADPGTLPAGRHFRVWLKNTATNAWVRITPSGSPIATVPAQTTYSQPWSVTQPAGTYKVVVYLYNSSEAVLASATSSGTFTIAQKPAPMNVTPASGSFTQGSSQSVGWDMTSAASTGTFRAWLKNTVTGTWAYITPTSSPIAAVPAQTTYTTTWNVNQAPGTYKLWVYYYRADGSISTTAVSSGTITVLQKPTPTITSPNSGSFLRGTSMTVNWSMSSATSVGTFRVWLKNTTTNVWVRVTPTASPVAAIPGATSYSVPWFLTQPAGTYKLWVYYYLADGSISATAASSGTITLI